MTRPNKLESLDDLKRHIDDFATEHGTEFSFDVFESRIKAKKPLEDMRKEAKCNYKTMWKWRVLYKELNK